MLMNFVKIAACSLWKHKGFSVMNIAGLALSIGSQRLRAALADPVTTLRQD